MALPVQNKRAAAEYGTVAEMACRQVLFISLVVHRTVAGGHVQAGRHRAARVRSPLGCSNIVVTSPCESLLMLPRWEYFDALSW